MGRQIVFAVILAFVLALTWFVLSDYWYKPLIVGFGALGIVCSIALMVRMQLLDAESVPFFRFGQFMRYWSWLSGEIVKSNVYVVKTAMKPELDIKPVMVRVPVSAKTDIARATYANSITLTPGTVTVEVEETGFLIHGLTDELTGIEEFRNMERQVIAATEGEDKTS